MVETELDSWQGYFNILNNGNTGSYQFLEEYYNQSRIGRNMETMRLEEALNTRQIPIVDTEGHELENIDKILYAHPSQVSASPGTSLPIDYTPISKDSSVRESFESSAILVVKEDIPIKIPDPDKGSDEEFLEETPDYLENLNTLLAGDEYDEQLRDEELLIKSYPMA